MGWERGWGCATYPSTTTVSPKAIQLLQHTNDNNVLQPSRPPPGSLVHQALAGEVQGVAGGEHGDEALLLGGVVQDGDLGGVGGAKLQRQGRGGRVRGTKVRGSRYRELWAIGGPNCSTKGSKGVQGG